MEKVIDLRSDTVTQPTPEMRTAMSLAEVGDDVYGEDPTVNRLQQLAAEKMGKEAGLLVTSGTMGNLIATLVHCQRGDEAIMGDKSHTFLFEVGGISALGGVFPHTLPNQPDGTLELDDIRDAVRAKDVHHPTSRLLILENTHNRCGGVVLSAEYTRQAGELAHEMGMQFHLDGARIFNAAVATGCTPAELAAPADSVTFCLSKGLCAPVGSVLCGSAEFIEKARRLRKMLGGGMRQAGVLAAAGIVALETMIPRLEEDHQRAKRLARGLSALPGLVLATGEPRTNMVFLRLKDGFSLPGAPGDPAPRIAKMLTERGIRVGDVGPRSFRLVTHYWIDDEAVDATIAAFQDILQTAVVRSSD